MLILEVYLQNRTEYLFSFLQYNDNVDNCSIEIWAQDLYPMFVVDNTKHEFETIK